VLPREPTDETENVFRAGKSRETERGNTSACTLCSAQVRRATMTLKILNLNAQLNKTQAAKVTTKMHFPHFTAFFLQKS